MVEMLKGRLKVWASFPVSNRESWKVSEQRSNMYRVEHKLEVSVGKIRGRG